MSSHELNEREAFVAMSRFLEQFANRAGNDLLTLLGDIHLEADGGPTDPAAGEDWMRCVRSVVDGAQDPAGGSAGQRSRGLADKITSHRGSTEPAVVPVLSPGRVPPVPPVRPAP